jgi:hypothetical protein
MSRAISLSLAEADVLARCKRESVGVSANERLPSGGVRLVCMSVAGAALIRRKFKAHLIKGKVLRERRRPVRPLW